MKQKCLKCGYEWDSKKAMPRSCPNCKRYDWASSPSVKGGGSYS